MAGKARKRHTEKFKDGFNAVLKWALTIKTRNRGTPPVFPDRQPGTDERARGNDMFETWEKAAVKIGSMIRIASKRYSQLIPLHTSWVNFARKHQVQQPSDTHTFLALLKTRGMLIIPTASFDKLVSTVKRQDEEIKALEYRITTLLRPE